MDPSGSSVLNMTSLIEILHVIIRCKKTLKCIHWMYMMFRFIVNGTFFCFFSVVAMVVVDMEASPPKTTTFKQFI